MHLPCHAAKKRHMRVRLATIGILLSTVLLLPAGCKILKRGGASEAGAGEAGAAKGLGNAENNAAVVALGKAASGCPRNTKDKDSHHPLLDPDCPQFKA